MSFSEAGLLLLAGAIGGVINSVASGGSFFLYPAMLSVGLTPIQASTSTLAALTPGNLAAVPEYWPEVQANRSRFPSVIATVVTGAAAGIALLLATGAEAFESLVPWLILLATLAFAASPYVHGWAMEHARTLTDGMAGIGVLFGLSVYLTYFGSGIGNFMLAMLTIRGFGDFLAANAAKNIVMSIGTVMAGVAYTVAGHIQWWPVVPVLLGSTVGARYGSKIARRIPIGALRAFVIAFGLAVAAIQFTR